MLSVKPNCLKIWLFLLLPVTVHGATFTVNQLQDEPDANPGDGKCSFIDPPPQFQAVCTLRAAIMEANATPSKDIIRLSGGSTYQLSIPGSNEDNAINGDLDIRHPVQITTFPSSDKAIIRGDNNERVFDIKSTAALSEIAGIGITRGRSFAGAAILNAADNLSLLGVDVFDNVDSTAAIRSTGSMTIRFSSIFLNKHPDPNEGGIAFLQVGKSVLIENSTIHDNYGKGIQLGNNASLGMVNSTISSNDWHGIFSDNSDVTLLHSTIVNNGNAIPGHGLRFAAPNPGAHALIMKNVALSSNNFSNCFISDDNENLYQMDWNVSSDTSCNPSGLGGANTMHNAPLYFSTLGNWGGPTLTHRPQTNAPVIDRTPTSLCESYDEDQRLSGRMVAYAGGEPRCDTGSVELETGIIFFDEFESL